MNNTWTVDPDTDWRQQNAQWLMEANLPGSDRCEDTFTGIRCELKAGHSSRHMIYMEAARPDAPPEN